MAIIPQSGFELNGRRLARFETVTDPDGEPFIYGHQLKHDVRLSEAELVSSATGVKDVHVPVIDVDVPIRAISSSTPGHFHLYIDRPMSWDVYVELLTVMAKAGIVEPGYVQASIARGATFVRLPWIKKETS